MFHESKYRKAALVVVKVVLQSLNFTYLDYQRTSYDYSDSLCEQLIVTFSFRQRFSNRMAVHHAVL
jgi:hypothetical protein